MNRQLKRQRCVHCSPEEQEMIRDRAKKAGKTVSGYLIDLGLNDDPDIHPLVLLPDEQKEMLDTLRRTCLLLERDDNAPPLIADIQVRVAVTFDLLAQEFTAKGKAHDFHAALVRVVGEERAATFMATVRSTTPKRPRKRIEQEPEPDLFS